MIGLELAYQVVRETILRVTAADRKTQNRSEMLQPWLGAALPLDRHRGGEEIMSGKRVCMMGVHR